MTDTQDFSHLRELAAKAADRHTGIWSDYVQMMEAYHHALNPATAIALLDKLEAAQAENLRQDLEYVEQGLRLIDMSRERDAALARLAVIEKQEPIGYAYEHQDYIGSVIGAKGEWAPNEVPLFAAAGASPEPSALQAENAKLITALAECRDAFPVPDAGSRLDDWYCTAMADPLQVPEYVKACVGASPVQPNQGLQSVADALTIEQLNDKVERLMAVQPSQDADHNAPWLTEAHMLCTDQGVPQGNISWRIQVLRELLAQPSQAGEPTEAQLVAGVKAMRLFVTKNSVKDFREGFIAAINAKGSK